MSIVPTAAKPRQVLAMLALNAGHVVSASALMTELWGQLHPRAATTTLHTYIGKLRRGIELAIDGKSAYEAKKILVTEQLGYCMNVPIEAIDIGRYERLARAGRMAADAGDYETAARNLEIALQLWRGPVMTDVAVGAHLSIEGVRLEENRRSDLDLRIEADLRLGRHRKVLAELAWLCTRFPMSENFCAKYMLALYRSGEQWRALEAFTRMRSILADELGVDPSTNLQELYLAILRRDAAVEDFRFFTGNWALTGAKAG
ncbi:MAG TPA: AfsR/SARP family transcriptional regulator [Actinophytocola sp.]|uniref:AfsR/SARP family transcriptional regulator n=1 Tax=Actinophytocola sp. TaxID=1872138 RepID=UPI002DBC7EA5|nr:AfsR/SARP family transcriptional regulator [Actinophytocola sp.]HEU5471974.1 AfsR/SARP family transcriptional regulator [Actinophytocola sp.]